MTRRTTQFLTLGGVVVAATLALGAAKAPTRAQLPLDGDLPRPLADLSSNELFEFGQSLRFDNGPVQQRICARAGCNGRVDGVRDQVPGAGNISANGTVVARLVNLGRPGDGQDEGAEAVYRTERQEQAAYYIVALRSANGWTWTVRKAVRGQSGPTEEMSSGNWVSCRHDPNNPTHPRGKSEFARCPGQGAGALFPPNDPAWITCSDGCCTANL